MIKNGNIYNIKPIKIKQPWDLTLEELRKKSIIKNKGKLKKLLKFAKGE